MGFKVNSAARCGCWQSWNHKVHYSELSSYLPALTTCKRHSCQCDLQPSSGHTASWNSIWGNHIGFLPFPHSFLFLLIADIYIIFGIHFPPKTAIIIIYFDHNHSIVAFPALVLMWQLFHKCWWWLIFFFLSDRFAASVFVVHDCLSAGFNYVALFWDSSLLLCLSLLIYSLMQILWLWLQYVPLSCQCQTALLSNLSRLFTQERLVYDSVMPFSI